MSTWPACRRCTAPPATNAVLSAASARVIVLALDERSVWHCSVLTAACGSRGGAQRCSSRSWKGSVYISVRQRIQYKAAVLKRKVRTTGAPRYLSQHLVQHVATRQTRSMALPLLTIPRTNTEFARRSFSYSAPFIWNSLPGDVLHCNLEHTFKKHLQTFLFTRATLC